MAQLPNRGSINEKDIMQQATVAMVKGQFNKIGEMICPAGIIKKIGFGVSSSQSDAEGRIYAKFMDNNGAGTEIKGKFRISIFSPQDRSMVVVNEWPTAALNSNVGDRRQQIPLPVSQYGIGKDYKFVYEFKPDADVTLSKANTVINIDSTEQLLA